jgi:hypothetical protein
MNDLEREIRATLHRHEVDAPGVDVTDVRRATTGAHRRQTRNLLVGGIVTTAIVALAVIGGNAMLSADRSQIPIEPPRPVVTPSPTPPSDAEPFDPEQIKGWPGARGNPPGIYSWDANARYAGWMHNVTGPTQVQFWMTERANITPSPDWIAPVPVTVGGLEATYQQVPAYDEEGLPVPWLQEQWIVRIDDSTRVIIRLEIPDGTPEDIAAEARSIVPSIQFMEWDSPSGYRLAFRLPAGWDSG